MVECKYMAIPAEKSVERVDKNPYLLANNSMVFPIERSTD